MEQLNLDLTSKFTKAICGLINTAAKYNHFSREFGSQCLILYKLIIHDKNQQKLFLEGLAAKAVRNHIKHYENNKQIHRRAFKSSPAHRQNNRTTDK